MTQVYFHCSNAKEVLIHRCGAMVDDLAKARDRAASVVRSLTMARSLEDWRRGSMLRSVDPHDADELLRPDALTAAASTAPIVPPLDEDVHVLALAHWRRAPMDWTS
jgi:hypothetical protein